MPLDSVWRAVCMCACVCACHGHHRDNVDRQHGSSEQKALAPDITYVATTKVGPNSLNNCAKKNRWCWEKPVAHESEHSSFSSSDVTFCMAAWR